jgi:hypothetical protein
VPTHLPEPRPRLSRSGDAICGAKFAAIISTAYPSTFEHHRRQNEYVYNPIAGTLAPFANALHAWTVERFPHAEASDVAELARQCEKQFRRQAFLCVPMWGGWKEPGGLYSYSERQAEAIRDRGLMAIFEAWEEIRSKGIKVLVGTSSRGVVAASDRDQADGAPNGDSAPARRRQPTRRARSTSVDAAQGHDT